MKCECGSSGMADATYSDFTVLKIYNHNYVKSECTMKAGDSYVPASRDMIIPQYLTSPIQKFILEKGTNIVKDLSEYELVFKKIG